MPTCRVLFGHVMSKATRYIIDNIKICVGFSEVSLKEIQSSLQKNHYLDKKKLGKGGIGRNLVSLLGCSLKC